MTDSHEENTEGKAGGNPPTHVAKLRHGSGRQAWYERIGVAWVNPEDGSVYVSLHGQQLVTSGFTCYPIDDQR